jgi:3'(2'), 5'-bisphosphate nucleotidase
MKENNANLTIAIQAALEAGEAIMNVYDSPDFGIEIKEDLSPLTKADKKANDIINTYLIPTQIPIISEENKQTEYSIRKDWEHCWIVDPVDGTKEFIKRNGEFTVNIALVTNGLPTLGVIYVPVTKTLYVANVSTKIAYKALLKNHKTTMEDISKVAQALQPKDASNTVQVVGSRSHMSEETVNYVDALKNEGKNVSIVSKGSSLKFCLVAEGNADVYPRFAPTMEWDTAAGQAICNAVGVSVISEVTKAPLFYNKENLLNPWFICEYEG